ncbi:hypothetical protein [Nostoc sp. KVJ20]|uniref:hypothetical protein n=1 Tax=Nostoc sp. KVJ20 TaxID=457944 RepID=UPI00114D1315|nr:hypothetical protein [Nostoc sp. KVJ20]
MTVAQVAQAGDLRGWGEIEAKAEYFDAAKSRIGKTVDITGITVRGFKNAGEISLFRIPGK